MERTAPASSVAAPPDPAQDPPATPLPNNIEVLLHVARYLLGYGRHLIDTIRQRAAAPNFNAIAACFGTSNLTTILAHLNRGILRCIALERVLLARAATGQDIPYIERRTRAPEPEPAPAGAEPQQTAAAPLPTRRRTFRASRPAGWNDPELFMPTAEDLERQIRRQPIGRVFLDISLDLAVVPGFCHGAFWNALFEIMTYFGSGVHRLMQQKSRRQEAFAKEQDRIRGANWDWVNMSRDRLRQVLGFFIGEPPVNPLDPAAAIATGPP
ncbi:MAG TPA: hypothetical protein VKI44_13670 [Acetobacteraceae bacterium]|nr:hypothetical protein [Acetobacteraceae bacterium]